MKRLQLKSLYLAVCLLLYTLSQSRNFAQITTKTFRKQTNHKDRWSKYPNKLNGRRRNGATVSNVIEEHVPQWPRHRRIFVKMLSQNMTSWIKRQVLSKRFLPLAQTNQNHIRVLRNSTLLIKNYVTFLRVDLDSLWNRRQNSSYYRREHTFGNGKKSRNMINRAAGWDLDSCDSFVWQIVSTLWPEHPVESLMMLSHHWVLSTSMIKFIF